MKPREDGARNYERGGGGSRRLFRDRRDAGEQLASALKAYRGSNPLVLGIPRGGVPVAYEVARQLDGELDVLVARKIAAPGQAEYAIGAVASDGTVYSNPRSCALAGVSDAVLARLTEAERAEAKRREDRFRAGLSALRPAGRVAIVVDDGLATGATMRAAVRSLRQRGAEQVVIAVPVGSAKAFRTLAHEADAIVCPHWLEPFHAVGQHYYEFDQTTDEEVERLLRASRERRAAPRRSRSRAV